MAQALKLRCEIYLFEVQENLLGAQQHGFIDSVGFDLYSQMLQDAIAERQTGVKKEEKPDIEILLSIDAYIPDAYIPDGYQRSNV